MTLWTCPAFVAKIQLTGCCLFCQWNFAYQSKRFNFLNGLDLCSHWMYCYSLFYQPFYQNTEQRTSPPEQGDSGLWEWLRVDKDVHDWSIVSTANSDWSVLFYEGQQTAGRTREQYTHTHTRQSYHVSSKSRATRVFLPLCYFFPPKL